MELATTLTALVAASALIPALVGAAARVPLPDLLSRSRTPVLLLLMVAAGMRAAPTSAATPTPAERLEAPGDRFPEQGPEPGGTAVEDLPPPVTADYVVEAGDSLWAIACRTLASRRGAAPDEAEVDRFWRAVYEINRELIGPDPDLIFPGQQLALPEEA